MQLSVIAAIALSAAFFVHVYNKICEHLRHKAKAKQWGCEPAVFGFIHWEPSGLVAMLLSAQASLEKRLPEYVKQRLDSAEEHYGRPVGTMTTRMPFFKDQIFTVDPANIQAVLALKFKDFGLGVSRTENFQPLLGNGIFATNGKQWEHSRSLLRPQFVRSQVSDLNLEEKHVKALMSVLDRRVRPGSGGWTDLVDLQVLFFRLTLDSATEFLFGESVNSLIREDGEQTTITGDLSFAQAFDQSQFRLSLGVMLGPNYWILHTPDFKRKVKKVHDFVDYFVEMAMRQQTEPDKDTKEGYVFLRALAKDTQDPAELRAQLLNILLAGRDTTASTLGWFFLTMADPQYSAIFRRLRAIILDEFGEYSNPRDISFERLKNCQYLQWCINECLRLYPVVPFNTRTAQVDTFLPVGGGCDGQSPVYVKKGQDVLYSVHAMHRRKSLWGPDADTFKPERWRDRRPGWDYLPFNGGPRICIGQQFALTEVGYVIVRLMQRIEAIDGSQVGPIKHGLSLTNCPGDGVKVRLRFSD
ncbi:hypothetical protein HIM_04236 [Hirsutella minnesotensis 3608]|uniref:Cytochrome P450 52A12 n=1 Tax=Hirsutella minnesotensis 3608 TaxID=1043627 RepID=A0A0F8A1T9_9HYPO|nr:hypothetical protein HIM_04236 [Hirsutella minnesotensis 3608]